MGPADSGPCLYSARRRRRRKATAAAAVAIARATRTIRTVGNPLPESVTAEATLGFSIALRESARAGVLLEGFGAFDGRFAFVFAFVGVDVAAESAEPAICSSVAARLPARDCASFERRGCVFFLLSPAFADPDAVGTDSVY